MRRSRRSRSASPRPCRRATCPRCSQSCAPIRACTCSCGSSSRDSPQSAWHSGLIGTSGKAKPAYRTFAGIAGRTAGASKTVTPGVAPLVDVALPELAATSPTGSSIAVTYRVFLGTKLVASRALSTRLLTTQGISFRPAFRPQAGKTYTLNLVAGNDSGGRTSVTDTLVAPGPGGRAS